MYTFHWFIHFLLTYNLEINETTICNWNMIKTNITMGTDNLIRRSNLFWKYAFSIAWATQFLCVYSWHLLCFVGPARVFKKFELVGIWVTKNVTQWCSSIIQTFLSFKSNRSFGLDLRIVVATLTVTLQQVYSFQACRCFLIAIQPMCLQWHYAICWNAILKTIWWLCVVL